MKTPALFKTTIVIWTSEDPTERLELEDLAREATAGLAYCSRMQSTHVEKPIDDPDWNGTEFFDENEADVEQDGPYISIRTGLYVLYGADAKPEDFLPFGYHFTQDELAAGELTGTQAHGVPVKRLLLGDNRWIVVDCEATPTPTLPILARCLTEDEAVAWIDAQPDHAKIARGGYGIDPPEGVEL